MTDTDTLQNVLHIFRTYAYHHILVACDSTETCDILAQSDNVVDFQHPRTTDGFEKFTTKTTKNGGKYIILIDGTTDASLYIQDLSLTNVIISNEKTSDGRPVISSGNISAEMSVVEANGALFLNVLAETSRAFNTSPFGMFFLIKTIFVGYHHDGSLESITNIAPFACTIVDTTADFSSAGAVYKLTFAGRQNGFSNTPMISGMTGSIYVGEEIADKSINGMPLVDVLKAVEDKFNQTQQDVRSKRTEGMTADEIAVFDQTYAPVSVKIKTHPDYQNYDYYVEAKDERNQNSSKSFYLEATTSATVQSVVESTLKMCKKILEDAVRDGEQFEPKINMSVTTKPNMTEGLLIDLYVDKIPKPKATKPPNSSSYSLTGVDDSQILQLNYIFTGKNVDILDFNMTMQFGNAFLTNMPTMSSIGPTTNSTASVSNVLPANGATTRVSTSSDPLRTAHNHVGTRSTNSLVRNTRDPVLTSKFYAALAQHSQFESIGVKLKIAGNPRFLGIVETNRNSAERPYEYVRINIMMPDPSVKNEHAPIPFWFDGVYRVLEYTTNFDGGMFTQELTLNVVPAEGSNFIPEKMGPAAIDQQGLTELSTAIDGAPRPNTIPPPIVSPGDQATQVAFIPPDAPRRSSELGDMRRAEYTLNRQK